MLAPLSPHSTADYQSAITLQVLDSAVIDNNYMINYIFSAENGNLVEGNFLIHIGAFSVTVWKPITKHGSRCYQQ